MQIDRVSPGDMETDDLRAKWNSVVRRRAFLKALGVAGALLPAGALLATGVSAADAKTGKGSLTQGDAAVLRFLAAAEILETDLWQQYNELGGVDGGNPAYVAALQNLDGDMPQYITDNTADEVSHAAFLNAYLRSRSAEQVNLEEFRTLPSSHATGAKQVRRLTNLQNLVVDTSFYTRYRSSENPDLGGTFAQAVKIANEPAIPLNDTDTPPNTGQPVPPVTRRLLSGSAPGPDQLAESLPGEPAYEQGYELRHAGVGQAFDRLAGNRIDRLLRQPVLEFELDRSDLRFDLLEHGRIESSSIHARHS
jgi:hypothetical protein